MKNLSTLEVINSESNTEFGFFFIEFSNGKSLQCCLTSVHQDAEEFHDNGPIFLNQIEIGNSGYSEGLCADCNEWAVVEGEWSHIEEFLSEQARNCGVQIVA